MVLLFRGFIQDLKTSILGEVILILQFLEEKEVLGAALLIMMAFLS
jgi:hypothetical protein